MQHVEVNAFGPLLMTQSFLKLLCHQERAVIANISARVGSIEDNRLGGWYSYRASKAALNQIVHGAALEMKRQDKGAVLVALHPGTVVQRPGLGHGCQSDRHSRLGQRAVPK